jgi:hypothetical protein
MESLIRQGRLSRHSLLVHLRTFLGSEIFYSSCDEEDAILKDIVASTGLPEATVTGRQWQLDRNRSRF